MCVSRWQIAKAAQRASSSLFKSSEFYKTNFDIKQSIFSSETAPTKVKKRENRSLVYSLFSFWPLDDNQHYHQLLYSLETARRYGRDLPIKVFLSPIRALKNTRLNISTLFPDVQVIGFDNSINPGLYRSYSRMEYAGYLEHRWQNVMQTFTLFGFDRILYLDCDTYFKRDPKLLFDKYTDAACVWARKDVVPEISIPLGLDLGMNDGQFLLSRQIFDKLRHGFAKEHTALVNHIVETGKRVLDGKRRKHLNWLVAQYAVYKQLNAHGIAVREFSREDVAISNEPVSQHSRRRCNPRFIMHHYFMDGSPFYLPEANWCPWNVQLFSRQKRGACSGCGYKP